MRIGFYAPLKAPDHPVPSGDRQMARLLIAALERAGHAVEVVSGLRSFAPRPDAPPLAALEAAAAGETARLAQAWEDPAARPDLLFTYHPYYKAPDLVLPALAAHFGLAHATAEASLSERRAAGPWAARQAHVAALVSRANINFCLTGRDRAGLAAAAAPGSLVDLPPFIDTRRFAPAAPSRPPGRVRLVTVAMMRDGDKLASYRLLAAALARLADQDWQLTIVGDGPARLAVQDAFASVPAARLAWHGAVASDAVPALLQTADVLVWPGLNEAFGLCYLEAQACGLPVVAVDNAGVSSVVRDRRTGLLTAPDPDAFAAAARRLVADAGLRGAMAASALAFVQEERSLPVAADRIVAALRLRLP